METVTIINNSGKIISTGKHLVNIFKEAKCAYQEKKAAVKHEREVHRGLHRAQTIDVPPSRYEAYDEYEIEDDYEQSYYDEHDPYERRRSHDDGASRASSRRSHRSHRSKASSRHHSGKSRPALTESNLQTLSEVSSTTPSAAPAGYRSPYAETMPFESALSRPPMHPPAPMSRAESTVIEDQLVPARRHPSQLQRTESDPLPRHQGKEIDMNLAYGSVPPDLADRVDLDPAHQAAEKERTAQSLVERIESMLTEAHCLHHTATSIIAHLQGNPEAAAAVALTLAELSSVLGKMSPAFLGALKGGSPAIFALLASPQFLIGTAAVVGVTVVMFGGWKIVKRMKEQRESQALAFQAAQQPSAQEQEQQEQAMSVVQEQQQYHQHPAPPRSQASFDEALVLEEELSSIETWRRGIVPFGEDESADIELMSREAERSMRAAHRAGKDDDTMSRHSTKTTKTTKTSMTSKTAKTSKTSKTDKTSQTHKSSKTAKSSVSSSHHMERKSTSGSGSTVSHRDDARSEAGSERSHKSSKSSKSHKSSASHHSRKTAKSDVKMIEGSKDDSHALDMVLRPKQKDNMLKTLFKKKKEKEEGKEKVVMSSTLV